MYSEPATVVQPSKVTRGKVLHPAPDTLLPIMLTKIHLIPRLPNYVTYTVPSQKPK